MFVAACRVTRQNTEDHSHVTHLSYLRMYTLKDIKIEIVCVSNHVYAGYFVTRMCSFQLFLLKCARNSVTPCLSVLFVNLNDCGD
jgi:hypothetical protein